MSECGCYSHTTKKCRTPSHLVDLYLNSVGHGRVALGQKYEAHFNIRPNTIRNEAGCSQQVPMESSNNNIRGGGDLADTGTVAPLILYLGKQSISKLLQKDKEMF